MKLLLTGSTGFVGRNLLLHFLKRETYSEIFVPVRSINKLKNQLRGEGFNSLPGVLTPIETEAPHWNFSQLKDIHHVVHSAGLLFGECESDYLKTNTEGTFKLLSSIPQPQKTVVLSSQAASGPCPETLNEKTENDSDLPITWYGNSKLEMERGLCERFPHFNLVCLRPPMILGARDLATLPLFKMAKSPIRVKPGFKPKFYSYISVDDLVLAIESVLHTSHPNLKADARHFFVASGNRISDRELIQTAGNLMQRKGLLLPMPQALIWGVSKAVNAVPSWRKAVPSLAGDRAREIWPDRWVVSPKKFETQFNWQAQDSLETALKSTLDWYIKSGELQ